MLTDGANTRGPRPLDVAEQTADRQVRVYTIEFGTTEFSDMVCTQQQLGSDVFSGDFRSRFGGRDIDFRLFLFIDEPTLQAMADITGGSYFRAESADQLYEVFRNLPTQIVLQKENLEISVVFLALGAIFVTAAVALSQLWNQFP